MKTIFLFAVALISFTFNANAQYGSIDLTFNGSGYNLVELSNGVYLTSDMLVLPDNRILVAGRRGSSLGTCGFPVVMRFNVDGSLDESFGSNGMYDVDWMDSDDFINAIFVASNDFIYLVGQGITTNSGGAELGVAVVAKLTFDGIPVNEFGDNGLFFFSDPEITSPNADFKFTNIMEDEGGEFFVCGVVNPDNSSDSLVNFVLKMTSDGSLSENFNPGGISYFQYSNLSPAFEEKPLFLEIVENGDVIVAGQGYNGDGVLGLTVSKFNSIGVFDDTFNGEGVSWNGDVWGSSLRSFALLDDGSMLLAADGDFGYPGAPTKVFKINSDGSPDNAFGDNGLQFYNFDYSDFLPSIFSDLKTTEGGFFVVERVNNPPLFAPIGEGLVIAKCNFDGSVDNSFGIDGKSYFIPTMQIQPTRIDVDNAGRIVVCGHTTNPSFNFFVARFNGVPDNVEEVEHDASLRIFPNPSSGMVNLNLKSSAQVRIFDLKGTLVKTVFTNGNEPLDLMELPAGYYAIQAISAHIVSHGKLIIE